MAELQLLTYAGYWAAAVDGDTVWDGSTDLTLTLHTDSYTPDRTAHTHVDDLTSELATGDGYTQGGVTLSSAATSTTGADSWSQQWASETAYQVGDIVRPTTGNGFVYQAISAGTSDTTEPTWPTTIGETVVDDGVTWACVGRAVVSLAAADLEPAWASFEAGPFRHVVLSDRAEGVAADQPLIGVYSYGEDQTGGGGDFDVIWASAGVIAVAVP